MTTYEYTGPPILTNNDPTDRQLYDLLLIGLRFQRIPSPGVAESKMLLGNMGNGVLIALEWLGVLTRAHRESLSTKPSFVGLLYSHCEVVRHPGAFNRTAQRRNIREVGKDLFTPVPESAMFAHGLLIATQGYRLYITDAGVKRADAELRPRYPLLTPDVFKIGWHHYRRQVRHSDIHHTRVRRAGEGQNGVTE